MQLRKIQQGLFNVLAMEDTSSRLAAASHLIRLIDLDVRLNAVARLPSAAEGVQDIRREYVGVNIDEV
jgi:hypothetical protein